LDLIGPEKDVDGLHPLNIGRKRINQIKYILDLALKRHSPLFYSCTPLGCLKLIESVCDKIEGKKVTICGRSNIVGMPLALLLNKKNATVSICHSKTPNIQEYVRQADIFISAVGCPNFFKGEWLKEGAIAIDVGINEILCEEPMNQKECNRLSSGSKTSDGN
jgi:methylenetetrahydrofolate dehydrogenase (NADP+)/methenyltetrahydrofolate cyclohydrolase/formyltetrahydrofolate synthetase